MSSSSITPDSFLSDNPPERYIGTECEYNLQNLDSEGKFIELNKYISDKALAAVGLSRINTYLSNGARLYLDVRFLLEYATQECLGPKQAAAADLAGILLLRKVIDASEEPHRGLYRITGSYLPSAKNDTATTDVPKGKTAGYHENYLISREISENPLIDKVLPSFWASRLWAMGGTIRDKYVFSQKIWGHSGEPIVRNPRSRTIHGNKPMAIIGSSKMDEDTIGDDRWARLEVRFADSGFSAKTRYLALAATSLILRMIEHEEILGTDHLARLGLKKPVRSAKIFASDLTLRRRVQIQDGRQLTALDIQESFAEAAIELSENIELPPGEKEAPQMWLDTCDALRASRPDKADYGDLTHELDIAAKHAYLARYNSREELTFDNPEAMQQVLVWDRALPTGGAQLWWKHHPFTIISEKAIESLVVNAPPNTRAELRAECVKKPGCITQIDWANASDGTYTWKFPLYPND